MMNNKYIEVIKNLNESIGITKELLENIKIPIHKEEKNLIFAEVGALNVNQFLEKKHIMLD